VVLTVLLIYYNVLKFITRSKNIMEFEQQQDTPETIPTHGLPEHMFCTFGAWKEPAGRPALAVV
jgi:hypothetical protein